MHKMNKIRRNILEEIPILRDPKVYFYGVSVTMVTRVEK